mmetsp:Transcript_42306/g.88845  ORF Transcript_42306/g.88845 Transcript_42306/m.88845 type:complete len:290 (-) Transcript_42306:1065-1934(-)
MSTEILQKGYLSPPTPFPAPINFSRFYFNFPLPLTHLYVRLLCFPLLSHLPEQHSEFSTQSSARALQPTFGVGCFVGAAVVGDPPPPLLQVYVLWLGFPVLSQSKEQHSLSSRQPTDAPLQTNGVGLIVGDPVGFSVGLFDGALVGLRVGSFVGVVDGEPAVGLGDGGVAVGPSVGALLGAFVGELVGFIVGDEVGTSAKFKVTPPLAKWYLKVLLLPTPYTKLFTPLTISSSGEPYSFKSLTYSIVVVVAVCEKEELRSVCCAMGIMPASFLLLMEYFKTEPLPSSGL